MDKVLQYAAAEEPAGGGHAGGSGGKGGGRGSSAYPLVMVQQLRQLVEDCRGKPIGCVMVGVILNMRARVHALALARTRARAYACTRSLAQAKAPGVCARACCRYAWLSLHEADAVVSLCAIMLYTYNGKTKQASEQVCCAGATCGQDGNKWKAAQVLSGATHGGQQAEHLAAPTALPATSPSSPSTSPSPHPQPPTFPSIYRLLLSPRS